MARFTNEELAELQNTMKLIQKLNNEAVEKQLLSKVLVEKYNDRMKSLLEEKGLDPEKKYDIGKDNELTEVVEEVKEEESKKKE